MLDYKVSTDDLSFSLSTFCTPQKNDIPFDVASAKALQDLNNIKNFYPEEVIKNAVLFHCYNKSCVDSSTYINPNMLSDLIAILKSEECIDCSKVLEIIYSLSKFDKVLEFLNDQDILLDISCT